MIAKATKLVTALTCLSFLSGCASVPEERKVTIQEIGQRGLSIGVMTRLFLDSGNSEVLDLFVTENYNAGLAHKKSVKAAFESEGIPIKKSLFIKSGVTTASYLESHTCRQLADITKYKSLKSQVASKDKCTLKAQDSKVLESALPYLTTSWEDSVNESMPESMVKELSARIDARYLLLFYVAGRERTERLKALDTGFKILTSIYPPALGENLANAIEDVVSDQRLYTIIVYDTYGGKLRKVLTTERECGYTYTPTDPRAWSEAQVKRCVLNNVIQDRYVRR